MPRWLSPESAAWPREKVDAIDRRMKSRAGSYEVGGPQIKPLAGFRALDRNRQARNPLDRHQHQSETSLLAVTSLRVPQVGPYDSIPRVWGAQGNGENCDTCVRRR